MKVGVLFGSTLVCVAGLAFGQASFVEATGGGNQIFDVKGTSRAADFKVIPELEGGETFSLTLDSASDILLFDLTLTDVRGGAIYDSTDDLGHRHQSPPLHCFHPPPSLICPVNAVYWWVTTPGGTSAVNSSNLLDGDTVTHFDTTDDGAQTNGFHFASFTLVPDSPGGMATATLLMSIQTAASPTPIVDDVAVTMTINPVPEPNAVGLVFIALLFGIARLRRRSAL